jgi:hypothetical protein
MISRREFLSNAFESLSYREQLGTQGQSDRIPELQRLSYRRRQ